MTLVPVLIRRRPGRDRREGQWKRPERGTPHWPLQRPCSRAGTGRRQRPLCPRHASTHRAAPTPGIPGSARLKLRSRRHRRPDRVGVWGAAGEPEGRGGAGRDGLEEAVGPERQRMRPETGLARGGGLEQRPEPARWAGRGVRTPPLNPVQTAWGDR